MGSQRSELIGAKDISRSGVGVFLCPGAAAGVTLLTQRELETVYLASGSGCPQKGPKEDQDQQFRLGRSPDPALDLSCLVADGFTEIISLSYPLPPGIAEWLERQLAEVMGKDCASSGRRVRALANAARRHLAHRGLPSRYRCERLTASAALPTPPVDADLEMIRQLLSGRLYFLSDIRRALGIQGVHPSFPLEACLTVLRLRGVVQVVPAVITLPFGLALCSRCGARFRPEKTPCPACGDAECPTCLACREMGEARGCRNLYLASDEAGPAATARAAPIGLAPSPPRPNVSLTQPQAEAVARLSRFLVDVAGPRDCLIRAVCGAGKTEVILPVVELAVRLGRRVLVTAPRREVVADLRDNLAEILGNDQIALAAGGTDGRFARRACMVATAHQALRFHQAFDLVVVDEGDAFPLRGDAALLAALRRAKAADAKTVWLSATPRDEILREVGRGVVLDIPARYHGYALPVPEIAVVRDRRQGLSARCDEFFTDTLADSTARVLVFVPTINLTQSVSRGLQASLNARPGPSVRCAASHAGDPARGTKLEQLRAGNLGILVTTSILERGVTIPHTHVLVLYADHRLYDWAALVQMAGRAGRSRDYPNDRVCFVAHTVSPEMHRARRHIEEQNELARRLGYLAEPDGVESGDRHAAL